MVDLTTWLLTLLLIVVPSLLYLRSYIKWKRMAAIVNKIPGPKTYPFIGTIWELLLPRKDLFAAICARNEMYGPFYRTWLGSLPEIHIMKAEHMEIILSSSTLIKKGLPYIYLQPWIGDGLLTSTGSKWHAHRKLITPTFHFKILENFLEVFMEKGQRLADQLKAKADGRVFDVYPFITHCALDIICETAMGVKVNAMESSNSDYVSSVYEMSELIMQRALRPWLTYDFIFYKTSLGKRYNKCLSTLHNFTKTVIKERRDMLENKTISHQQSAEDLLLGKKKRLAFLDLLMDASKGGSVLTDTDIREEVDTFMFEGHDTTTAAICWVLFLLGNHQEIQDKVAEELAFIFDGEERSITMADLGEMKLLERVIKEALRLYPSVPFVSRQITHPIQIDEYEIPVGCVVILQMFNVHRDARYFPDPLTFNPDNFLPERCQQRHPFAYVPFSAGLRNCIGQKFAIMEEKTVLAAVLRQYKVTALEKPSDIKLVSELILRPQEGIKVSLQPRYR